jgi:hypothetical protein
MSRFTLSIHGKLVRQGLENLSSEIPQIGRQRIYLRMLRIRTRMSANAPKVRYPIDWDSPKQKRKVLAMLRERGDLPYRRRGKIQHGWELDQVTDGYRLRNREEGSFFVFGDLSNKKTQSNIHANTWPLTKTVTYEELDQLPEEISYDIERAKKRSGL